MSDVDLEFRPSTTKWKVWRTDIADPLADPDWADDISDPLPTEGIVSIQWYRTISLGKNKSVEFRLIPYVDATGLEVDASVETFSVDVTYLDPAPKGSSIKGRSFEGEMTATRLVSTAGHRYKIHYRFENDGADHVVLRLHSPTGTPAGADRYELQYREVTQ